MGVYVIGHDPEGPVKIGKAVDPEKRLSQLQGGSGQRLFIFYFAICGHVSMKVEKAAHKLLSSKRGLGEWFSVSAAEAESAVVRSYMDLVPEHLRQRIDGRQYFDGLFIKWLHGQVARKDPIGDLARDVRDDLNWPKNVLSIDDIYDYLEQYDDVVMIAFFQAWEEWSCNKVPSRIKRRFYGKDQGLDPVTGLYIA